MLTPNELDRLQKRFERWGCGSNPTISVNRGLELVALARKGLDAERLEKEADWLAAKLEYHTDPYRCDFGQGSSIVEGARCHLLLNRQNCVECWRKAARNSVGTE